jgi:hypothetical protein
MVPDVDLQRVSEISGRSNGPSAMVKQSKTLEIEIDRLSRNFSN